MKRVPVNGKAIDKPMYHSTHMEHSMKPVVEMSFWERLKMSMTMTMGMDHTGFAGSEMAKLIEEDIKKNSFSHFY